MRVFGVKIHRRHKTRETQKDCQCCERSTGAQKEQIAEICELCPGCERDPKDKCIDRERNRKQRRWNAVGNPKYG